MQDRFKFNAIVSSYYDIDTPENYEEFEPQFYLKNVDVFCTGEIGVDYDVLFEAVKEQSKNLNEKEIGQIMQHFEDNSNSPDCDFVTITPDKILQCTGMKAKDNKLVFEDDIVKILRNPDNYGDMTNKNYRVVFKNYTYWLQDKNGLYPLEDFRYKPEKNIIIVGKIYENPELLNE